MKDLNEKKYDPNLVIKVLNDIYKEEEYEELKDDVEKLKICSVLLTVSLILSFFCILLK